MPPTGHQVSAERLKEFCYIYEKLYGEEITMADASEMTHRLLALYRLLMQPLPGDVPTPSSPKPPAQTSPEAS